MGKKHLLFASYEIHPVTAGGCGVFLWHAINELLRTTEHDITLLLDIPKFECEEFIQKYQANMINGDRLKVICLADRIPYQFLPMEAFDNIFLFKSYMFYEVLKQVVPEEQIDYVEFFDYVGIGYFTVNAKKYAGEFSNTLLGVRGHCTVDLMDLEQCQVDFSQEKIEMYQMEKDTLQNADVVLVQTEAWKDLYATRYKIDNEKIIVAEPPIDTSEFPKYEPVDNNNVLFYGRVFQLKGIDDFINAGIEYCRKRAAISDTKFYIVGYDGTNQEGKSYTEQIKASIPDEFKNRFIFTGKLSREEFKPILDNVSVAIFPNYVESFCYSIHEIYEAGVPIICREIPAFTSYFKDNENCLMFKDNASQLEASLEQLMDSKELQKKLSFPKQVLKRKLQREIYDEVINSQKHDEIYHEKEEVKEKISFIYVCDREEKVDFELYLSDKEYKELVSKNSFIIYTNNKISQYQELKGQKFLGRDVHIQTRNTEQILTLERSVVFCSIEDRISKDFIIDSQRILKQKDVGYVMSPYKTKRQQVKYPKCMLLKGKEYKSINGLQPMIINNSKEMSLESIFDFRVGQYGQLKYLQGSGYVIPKDYGNICEFMDSFDIKLPQLILSIVNSEKDLEWNPMALNIFIDKRNEPLEQDKNWLYMKRIYHKLKDRCYRLDSNLGKIGIEGLMYLRKCINGFKQK